MRVILALLLALVLPVQASRAAEDKFDWSTSSSAPRGTPIAILGGGFMAGDQSVSGIPTNYSTHSGWGQSNSAYVGGPDRKPAPGRLDILFYSWLEDRFYSGDFALPRDRIAELLKKGRDEGKGTPLGEGQDFTVGAAPGGVVAVWLNTPTQQIEVFFGRAKPVDLDWHEWMDYPTTANKRDAIDETLKESAKHDPLVPVMRAQLPLGRWDAFRTRFKWRVRFEGIADATEVTISSFVNGEADRSWRDSPFATNGGATGPAPTSLVFTSQKLNRRWEFALDDEEVFRAFATTAADADQQLVQLVASVPSDPMRAAEARLTVTGGNRSVSLTKAKLDIFSAR